MDQPQSFEEIISKFICTHFIDQENFSKLEVLKIWYGLSILIINIVKIFFVYLVSFILNIVEYTLITHLVFIFMRRFCYGYHATKSYLCTLWGIILFSIIPFFLMQYSIKINLLTHLIVILCSILIVVFRAPQISNNSLLKNINATKYKAITMAIFLSITSFIGNNTTIHLLIVYGILVSATLLLITSKKTSEEQT
ncbi:accessory gene regulator B family protein [Carnobacterium divergens]|uniref:accessory gene regulator B family protein n=1 Tax=Carnobacterium divergens TaxID=2748 RepID=UPI00107264A4|nr:accessory gene regulator B family protein [Carnobacterium divergens]TFI76349.1 hypothetical protein CKN81_00110 [Carnobacterium divergens]